MRMAEITARQVLNKVNNEEVTLYVEWHEENFTIMLWDVAYKIFQGQMTLADMKYFSDELSKSQEEYLQETRNAFKKKNTEIQFFIKENIFEWKRNNVWTLGRISLSPVSDSTIIFKTLQRVLSSYEVIQEKVSLLEVENNNLKSLNLRLTSNIEDMIRLKEKMEIDLYKRFILVLNSKKQKIRELHETMKENKKDPIFDASTDEDSSSDVETKEKGENEQVKPEKRKLDDLDDSSNVKSVKMNLSKDEKESEPIPSTSKHSLNQKDNLENDENVINETNEQNCKKKKFHSRISFIVEEDSDEDLFS